MKKAIFMDRDGVICEEKNMFYKGSPITRQEQFEWIPESKKAFSFLSSLEDYLLVIVTNQSSINGGLLSIEDFYKINQPIYDELRKYNRSLDGLYFCPHVPKEKCECRKPKIGMLLQAKIDLDIDLEKSYFIGDKTGDIKTGKDAGCKTILSLTGYGGKDYKYDVHPDFIIKNLLEMPLIINGERYGSLL
jgi:D,D-heptose 1,7-bisphosphate phosphatase